MQEGQVVIAPSTAGVGMKTTAAFRGKAEPYQFRQPTEGTIADEEMALIDDDGSERAVPFSSLTPVWIVQFNGPVTDDVQRALAVSGLQLTGTWSRPIEGGVAEGPAAGSVEVPAESADAAKAQLEAILEPHGTYTGISADALWANQL